MFRIGLEQAINNRIEKYFDVFHIDEIQDFGGYDFDFLISFSKLNISLNWVGDFYQHTYDTSRDANKNKPLHSTLEGYLKRFSDVGIGIDQKTLLKSWRCSKSITDFISKNLGINIETHKKEDSEVRYIDDQKELDIIVQDDSIIKLFYQSHNNYNCYSSNWGKLKGADYFQDVCVVLNKTSHALYEKSNLIESASLTKNKLYVACSRANGNLFLVPETLLGKYKFNEIL